MATYEIRRKDNGEVYFSGSVQTAVQFLNLLIEIKQAGQSTAGQYMVRGSICTIDEAISRARDEIERAEVQRSKTHRKITYYVGAAGAAIDSNRRTKWVRR
jgi:hypothetical protein